MQIVRGEGNTESHAGGVAPVVAVALNDNIEW